MTFINTSTTPNTSTTITDYLQSTTAASTYATKASPTFSGTVTFPDASTITDYLKSTTAASTYAPKASPTFSGKVTFPDANTITDYLKSSDASSTYLTQTNAASTYLTTSSASSTYAPLVSPTFTENIVLNGNVTLAQTSANTLTLNDHLILCTGTNWSVPSTGRMLGFGSTGAIVSDTLVSALNITSSNVFSFGSVTLTYGIWLIYGTAGFQITTNGTITSVQVSIGTSSTSISGNFGIKDDSTQTVTNSTYMSHQVMRIMSVSSASVTHYLVGKYTFTGCTLNSRVGYSSLYAYRVA